MDKEYLKIYVKDVDTQLFEIVSNLICSICKELFNNPTTTPCGHSFCSGCIKRYLSSKDNNGCPLCKSSVTRYGLEKDTVKSTIITIFKELPGAFQEDVEEFTKNNTQVGEDFIKTSKLFQFYNQEHVKESNTSKRKSTSKKKMKKTEELRQTDCGSESFIPVLKRSKNVIEYASVKKKKMDDLVSVSQTEPASNSSFCDFFELDKKLENIEKIPPEKKVNEWFKAVGDNIYINSPSSSILEADTKNALESDTIPATIEINDTEPKASSKNEDCIKSVDPYEFVPSQNNNMYKKKHLKRLTRKKIPGFKTLQSFSKEGIKKNTISLEKCKNEVLIGEDTAIEKQVTASQKFEQLLNETEKDEKKPHALYSSSQSSSAQFLDVSFHSKTEEMLKEKKTPTVEKINAEDVLFKNVEVFSRGKGDKNCRSKRKRSVDTPKRGKKKKLFSDVMEMKTSEASELEESVEKHLIKRNKKPETPPTKLKELLAELLDDDIIYATRPANAPVRLPDLVLGVVDTNVKSLKAGTVTQNTDLIGFCTQEETQYEKSFKQMVENLEKELNSSEYLIEASEEEMNYDYQTRNANPLEENNKNEVPICENEQKDFADETKISKTYLVEFLHLGRLTPIRKRAKSTVVKLVFPIGLTSLARRHGFESRCPSTVPFAKKQICQVSTGIQTSHETMSCLVQTSQVPQSSFNMQTSQEVKPSVEIQTTQKLTTTAEIQTSQRLVCEEIQTSQTMCESAQVQTTQPPLSFNSNPKLSQTPTRKPSRQHRKIIQRKNSVETPLNSPLRLFPLEDEFYVDKDSKMSFEIEKELDETWRNTHEELVEMKNLKNKKMDGVRWNAPEADSDDSDVLPPRKKSSFRIFSQESTESLKNSDTRQSIPLNEKKINKDEDVEVIDLGTPGSQNSSEQMLRVLKNIDLDLPKKRSGIIEKGEKSEESDSDFFVEQTPPRPTSRAFDDIKNLSKSRNGLTFGQKQSEIKETEKERKENLENSDLIGDSLPKGFSESFLLSTAPQRIPLTPEKNLKDETQKKISKIEPTLQSVDLPDENDQNQLNAFEGRTKSQLKTWTDAWKQNESATIIKTPVTKKICVVASSVKNPDLIKKFVNKFKIEYSNKPTKDMTHLIVGLHENEDKEVLPLCTPKLLFAMANKKWVVNEHWAESCVKMNTIMPEDTFETLDPVGGCGCQKARLSNEKLLKNCEIYLLGEFQMISKEEFGVSIKGELKQDLISDCGGSIVPAPEKFSYLPSKLRMIIADRDCLKLNEKQLQDLYQKYSTVILSRDVIIMSIQSYKLVNIYPYLLHVASEENLVKLGYPLHLVKNDEEEEDEGEDSNGVVCR